MSVEGTEILGDGFSAVAVETLSEWMEKNGIFEPVEEEGKVETFVPHDQAQEGHHEKPMSPWAAEAVDNGDMPATAPSLKFEGIHMEQGDLTALKLDQEISVVLPQKPPNKWIYLMVQRAQSYINIPVINDKKFKEEEDENLAKYPFRVLRPDGQVIYREVNIDGTVHLAAKVFVQQNNKINLVFTRIGLDRIGTERTDIRKPSQGKEWMLKALDSNNLAVLAEKKIQVFVEIRKPGKKRLQSGPAGTSVILPKKIKQEVPEVAKEEKRPKTGYGPTMMVYYGQNKNKMISHLGQEIFTDIDPVTLPDFLSVNRFVFKDLAIGKIRQHFGNEADETDLGDYDITFSLRTLSDYGRQVYNQTAWEGGPVEAVLRPELVEPQLGPDGRPFHIIDCRIDLGGN